MGPNNGGQATHSSEKGESETVCQTRALGAMELDIQFKMFISCFEIPLG